jgi:hypothetical protein
MYKNAKRKDTGPEIRNKQTTLSPQLTRSGSNQCMQSVETDTANVGQCTYSHDDIEGTSKLPRAMLCKQDRCEE